MDPQASEKSSPRRRRNAAPPPGLGAGGNPPAPLHNSAETLLGPPPPEPEPAAVLLPWHWYTWLWMNPKAQFAWILVALSLSACLSNSWQPYSSLLFGHEVFIHRCSDYEIEIHREETHANSGDDFGRYEPACPAQNRAIGVLYASGNIAMIALTIAARTMMQTSPPYHVAAVGATILIGGFVILGVAPISHSVAFVFATLCIGGSWGFVMGPGGSACDYWGRYKNYAHALVVAANSCSSFVISILDSLVRHTPGSFREVILFYTAFILTPVALCYVTVIYLAKKRAARDKALLAVVAAPKHHHRVHRSRRSDGTGRTFDEEEFDASLDPHNRQLAAALAEPAEADTQALSAGIQPLPPAAASSNSSSFWSRTIFSQFDSDGILDPFCIPIRSSEESHPLVDPDATLNEVVRRPEFIIFSAVMMISATSMHFYTVTLRSVAGENVARFLGFIMPLVLLWDYLYGLSVNFMGMTFLWFVQIICLGLSFVCTFATRWGWHYVGTILFTLCSAFSGHLVYVFTNEYLPSTIGWKAQNILNILNIASVLLNSALTNVTNDMRYIANCILGGILLALLGISAFEVFVKKHERMILLKRAAGTPGNSLLDHPDNVIARSPHYDVTRIVHNHDANGLNTN